jgi:hypothetical protein
MITIDALKCLEEGCVQMESLEEPTGEFVDVKDFGAFLIQNWYRSDENEKGPPVFYIRMEAKSNLWNAVHYSERYRYSNRTIYGDPKSKVEGIHRWGYWTDQHNHVGVWTINGEKYEKNNPNNPGKFWPTDKVVEIKYRLFIDAKKLFFRTEANNVIRKYCSDFNETYAEVYAGLYKIYGIVDIAHCEDTEAFYKWCKNRLESE